MKPSIVLSKPQEQCVTFFWNEMPQNHLGYRFLEGQPTVAEQPIVGHETQPVALLADQPPVIVASHKQISNPLWKKGLADCLLGSQPPGTGSIHLSSGG